MLGTLLGAGVTHRFQVRATERTERFARDERMRAERMDVYSTYAGALVNYRRALVFRWFQEHEGGQDEAVTESRMTGYELRSIAQEALFRVQMVAPDDGLVELALEALQHIDQLHKAPDRAELNARRDSTRAQITGFVSAAKLTL